MRKMPTVGLVVFCAILSSSVNAANTESSESSDNVAKTAFEEAKALHEQGEFSKAAQKFRIAYKHKKTWKLLYNIGQTEAAAKRYGLALEAFERYLSEGGDDVPQNRRTEVLDEITTLGKIVGDIDVQGPRGAKVYIDETERARLPLVGTIIVSSGTEHRIVVKLKKNAIYDRVVRVRSGQQFSITIPIQAATAPSPLPVAPVAPAPSKQPVAEQQPEPPAPQEKEEPAKQEQQAEQKPAARQEKESKKKAVPQPGNALKLSGFIIGGTGIGLLAAGTVTGLMVNSKQGKLDQKCEENICYGDDTRELEESKNNLALITDIFMISGAVLAATGGILLITYGRKKKTHRESLTLHKPAPIVTNNTAGLVLGGSF